MTTERSRHLGLGSSRLKWPISLILCLSAALPVTAEVVLTPNAVNVDGASFRSYLSTTELYLGEIAGPQTSLSAEGLLVVDYDPYSVMEVDASGLNFPDYSRQTSAAYSKTELDAMLASLTTELRRAVRPRYYLTPQKYFAPEALTACVDGHHMASIFELADPSYLVYEVDLGERTDDSGQGPPLSSMIPHFTRFGWVRTGGVSGEGNCDVWTTTAEDVYGSAAGAVWDMTELTPGWQILAGIHGPSCATELRVWCIEDQLW